MYPDCDTLSNAPHLGYITARDQSMVESGVTEGRKTLKSRIKLNKRLHYTTLVSVSLLLVRSTLSYMQIKSLLS